MPLPTTGPISLADIAAEFGGSAPHSISEYYSAAAGVPSNGSVGIGVFRGKSAITTFFANITTNQQELNLYNYLVSQGWDGTSPAEVTIDAGVYIWSDNTSVAALHTGGAYPGGLTIINNGFIMGKGGNGGYQNADLATYTPPTSGGPAIILTQAVTIENSNGYIGGGGGGGAGSTGGPINILNTPAYAPGGGGAGGGLGAPSMTGNSSTGYALGSFGLGGALGQHGTVAQNLNTFVGHNESSPGGAGGASGASSLTGTGV